MPIGSRRLILMGRGSYTDKVIGYGPIAYWVQGERSGTNAACQINSAQDGTYTGVTLGQAGIGDGSPVPLYDGTNDYLDVQSATFATAFSGAAGTVHAWYKVSAVGVWTDGTVDRVIYLAVDADNFLAMSKNSGNNELAWYYEANTTVESVVLGSLSTLDWFAMTMTWSGAADEMKAYYNGAQTGSTQTTLGTWVGSIATSFIGSTSNVPAHPASGNIAHVAVWDRVLTATEIADLAVV